MAEISCPYCNNRNCLKISYAYRGINKNKPKDIDFDKYRKKGTIYKNTKKCYEKYDFDGKKITARLYNRYCQDCLKEFHSMGKMAVIDIKIIQIIIGNEDSRVKLVIDLSEICMMADLNYVETRKVFERWIRKSNYDFDVDNLLSSVATFDYEMSSSDYYNILKKLGYDYGKYNNFRNKYFYKELNYKIFINQAVKHLLYELENEEKQIVSEMQYEMEDYK